MSASSTARSKTAAKPTTTSAPPLTDASFVRFGGLAGILLAVTSLVTVAIYYIAVPAAQHLPLTDASTVLASLAKQSTGSQFFSGCYALIAFWALIGIVAVYYRVREAGQAWALFATIVGAIAAVGTIGANIYQIAQIKYLVTLYATNKSLAIDSFGSPSPVNPLGLMSFALTAVWFVILATLMLRTNLPRLLAYLGYIAFADLTFGFIVTVAGSVQLAIVAALIAGVVGGPAFWVWFGALLWHEQD